MTPRLDHRIERLSPPVSEADLHSLAAILVDAVESGAAVSFLALMPKNRFVTFVLEQFGRPQRNSSVQCDCARQSDASLLQVLTLANHPRIWQKVADPAGRVAEIVKQTSDPRERIQELYLSTLSRQPSETEVAACLEHVTQSESPEKGLQAVLWSLLNTREFLLQHRAMTCPPEIEQSLLHIVRTGVLNARLAGWSGDAQHCAIECDHIHNLPGLLESFSIEALHYY